MTKALSVSQLMSYPVKSLAGVDHQVASIDTIGIFGDRRWMLVDSQGNFLSQRLLPRMCLIQAQLNNSIDLRAGITLSAPEMAAITIQIPSNGPVKQVKVWNDLCDGIDCGDAAAEWLSVFLSHDSRLVFFADNYFRPIDPSYALVGEGVSFADGFPILLCTQASLDELNRRLKERVQMHRFRPNIVLDGCEPFAEDTWQRIQIDDVVFRLVKPCSRCSIPNIDPNTAKSNSEVLRTLGEFRLRQRKIYFGQNLVPESSGSICVGSTVDVLN